MADRHGVEIDYCPKCRGVWLDRGELDKIIERSADYSPNNSIQPTMNSQFDRDDDYYKKQYQHGGGYYNDPHNRHKKKKGFLGDFFDFD